MAQEMKIERNPRGYFTLYLNGRFVGNFDTVREAIEEAERSEDSYVVGLDE